jgi:ribosomal protein L37AE/L43A
MQKKRRINLTNGCPACELVLKKFKQRQIKKCKTCGHLYTGKNCELDHYLLKNGLRSKKQ